MGFRNYFGGVIVFGCLYALAGLAWSGVFGFSLSVGALIGFLVGTSIGLIFTHRRITEIRTSWLETTSIPLSPEVEKKLALGIGMGPVSNLTRVGYILAVVGLIVWAIVALLR